MTTNILVVIDPEEAEHSALNRIKEIPATADVRYKVDLYLDALPVLAREAGHSPLKDQVESKREWLEALVHPLRDVGYTIDVEVVAFTKLYEEIIKSARKFGADFVFKPLRQHDTIRRVFFTSTDWNLVRLCSVPLLLVNDQPSVHGKPVIAAVDVGDEDEAHKELNEIVLEQANLLARVLASEVHVIYAYGPAAVASRAAVGDPLAYKIARGKYDEELAVARELAARHGVTEGNVHLREGVPDIVLDDYAKESGAGVIVLGTVARRGASGFFVGNTAEAALERTDIDVFVVKQADYKSPL